MGEWTYNGYNNNGRYYTNNQHATAYDQDQTLDIKLKIELEKSRAYQ